MRNPYSLTHSELFTVVLFKKNRIQRDKTFHNDWIGLGLGKIGVVQQGCYIPASISELFADPTERSFYAIARVVRETSPGKNKGAVILHPIAPLHKAQVRTLDPAAFSSHVDSGTSILKLQDADLAKGMLWTCESSYRSQTLAELGCSSMIADVSVCVRNLAQQDRDIAHAVASSDRLMAMSLDSGSR